VATFAWNRWQVSTGISGNLRAEYAPHGYHLADALPKLKGLARYAEINAEHFRRIEAVTAIGNGYKVLDLSEPAVRAAIRDATNAKTLYESSFAAEYLDK
jgi:type III restriction enzyme